MNAIGAGVLGDVTVLDFSTLLPGPLAGLVLAEAGAEVIKVERPGGEDMRQQPADFALLNRGKRSVEIDLKAADAVVRLRPLIERADVLVEQFRPGVMQRLGLGPEAVQAINGRLIYCSINSYGAGSSAAGKAGHDLTYAAEAGLLAQSVAADGSPIVPTTLTADIGAGAYPAVINILLALLQREHTGRGAVIEIAMFDHLFPFLQPAFASAYGHGCWPGPNGLKATGSSPRYAVYRTRDGRHIAAAPAEDKFWTVFCDAIGLEAAWRDSERDPEGTRAAVAERIASRTAAEWETAFAHRDVASAKVLSFEEAMASPLVQERQILQGHVTLDGMRLPALPVPVAVGFRAARGQELRAPLLGEANGVLLADA